MFTSRTSATGRGVARAALGLVLSGSLAGCAVGPHYQAPKTTLAANYAGAGGPAARAAGIAPAAAAVAQWWAVFDDPILNNLVDQAVRGNRDLKEAQSRLREARAERAMVSAGLWPEAEATGGYDRARGSKNVVIPFSSLEASQGGGAAGAPASQQTTRRIEQAPAGGQGTAAFSGGAPPGGPQSPFGEGGLPGVTTSLYQAGFDATWEIDIFGGSRRAIEAADAAVAASEESRRGVLVSLLGEVAGDYTQLRTIQERMAIARRALATQRASLGIAEARFRNGFATRLDVREQAAQAFSTAAAIPALDAAARNAVHSLAYLCGQNPSALDWLLASPAGPPRMPPVVPVGVPSDLLRRRPDVREAERRLAGATAQVGVATAALFPTFSLTGLFGWDSSQPKNLPEWSSHYYSIAPGISWPILDWGRARASLRATNEQQRQSLLAYEGAVAGALRDVENALVQYEEEKSRRSSLADAAAASRDSWAIARQSYEKGLTDMVTTLDAERSCLAAQDALAQSDGALRTDLIALYKALGGGWE